MGHINHKIEELIRKDILGILTEQEDKVLNFMRRLYTEEEYDAMEVEVLLSLDNELLEDVQDDEEPDYELVVSKGLARKRKRELMHVARYAAAVMFFCLLGAGLYWGLNRDWGFDADFQLGNSGLLHRASQGDIPIEESSCFIYVSGTGWVEVNRETKGRVHKVGRLLISRADDGVLEISQEATKEEVPPTVDKIQIYTKPRQQCVVQLHNGSRIRMNAQTRIDYPLKQAKDTAVIELDGEAYVEAYDKRDKSTLLIGTAKGEVKANYASFFIRANQDESKVMLVDGRVDLYANSLKKDLKLSRCGDLGMVLKQQLPRGSLQRDTLLFAKGQAIEQVQQWTQKVRVYRDMPLVAFVHEMSRWEGFTIKNWDCIPKNKQVTVTIPYTSGDDEVFAAIRDAGVLLYHEKTMISFCDEDVKPKVALCCGNNIEERNVL